MNRFFQSLGALLSGAGLALAATGCKHECGHRCNVDPPGAMPLPLGTLSCQWQQAQMERADLDDFVFYSYEWQASGVMLSQYGQEHLEAMAERIVQSPYPVVVARSDNQRLDESRREALILAMASLGIENASERVVVARPKAEGLMGVDVPLISAGFASEGQTGRGSNRSSLPGSGTFGAGFGLGGR